mgnify:CR=1 FL=1
MNIDRKKHWQFLEDELKAETEEFNKKFISKLKKQYNISLDMNKLPAVLTIVDKELQRKVYIEEETDVETFIEYGVLNDKYSFI